ncbi:hypothetical protein [Aquilutibacter rugosus]|uniref:hypothetical protein n=1 Tax=Aquilutibacter rugosus TaxID=3115820 RepID=UPI002F40364E
MTSVTIGVSFTGTYDIGELFIGDAIELPLQTDLSLSFEDATVVGDTIGLQPANVLRPYRRRWLGVIQVQDTAATFTNTQSLQTVARALMGRKKAAFIPMTATPATGKAATNQALIDATATFGFAEQVGEVSHVERGYWTMAINFVEIP